MRIFAFIFFLFQFLLLHGQTRSSTYHDLTFEILFGGHTVQELNCDSLLFSQISNQKISIRNNIDKSLIDIDSFVAYVLIPRGPVYRYEIKGDTFPTEIQEYIINYQTGIMISIDEVFYYNESKYLFHRYDGNMLWLCKPQIGRVIREGEFIPAHKDDNK
jgi:hypothetical protein